VTTTPAVRSVTLALLVLGVGSGCEDTFEPYKSSDRHFSIFGYLNAAADTQWIRVAPIRQSVFTTAGKLHRAARLDLPVPNYC